MKPYPVTEHTKLMRILAPIRKIELGQRTNLSWWAQELRMDIPNTIIAMGNGESALEALQNMKALPQFEGSTLRPATWIGPVIEQ